MVGLRRFMNTSEVSFPPIHGEENDVLKKNQRQSRSKFQREVQQVIENMISNWNTLQIQTRHSYTTIKFYIKCSSEYKVKKIWLKGNVWKQEYKIKI